MGTGLGSGNLLQQALPKHQKSNKVMNELSLVFPHQLFKNNPALAKDRPVYLVEETLFFSYQNFHKQKLVFHRASMKAYANYLNNSGFQVNYIEFDSELADTRALIKKLLQDGVKVFHFCELCDYYLQQRLEKKVVEKSQLKPYESPQFLNSQDDLKHFFKPNKKVFRMAAFYKQERIKLGILLEGKDSPKGGKWSYDIENRKKYPKDKTPPPVQYPDPTAPYKEALDYVDKHFAANYGKVFDSPLYPINFEQAEAWLAQFLEQRFAGFGPYEDAIVKGNSVLHHSVLTPLLNSGLLTPKQVLDCALDYAGQNNIALNTVEGFVRQIIGWREFMRGMYGVKGVAMRTKNFWGFSRKIPESFYTGNTGIEPVDHIIKQVLNTAYCHHIERLMVLGNFMLLCEFDPDEVFRWFMELFIDGYDWVMVPNVYGMSQFADGGLFATKPYISSSNYIKKMSNFKSGEWEATWDGLFWHFMDKQRNFFSGNPRLAMLLSNFDKMEAQKRELHLNNAQEFLKNIN